MFSRNTGQCDAVILNENAQLCFVPFTKESDVKYAKVTGGLGRFILKGNLGSLQYNTYHKSVEIEI